MKREHARTVCDDAAARLLPWFVNGTLSNADARRVASHLEGCETCRLDVAEQRTVQGLLRTPAHVEHSPQAGLRKLLERIDGARDATAATDPVGIPPRWRFSGGTVRWLAAAVIVQGVALSTIAGVELLRQPTAGVTGAYRTLTSAHPEKASLRVVFAPTMTLAELQDLLRVNRLTAVEGPSDGGIFTLGLDPAVEEPEALSSVLSRLRADPRVRFAEALGEEAPVR